MKSQYLNANQCLINIDMQGCTMYSWIQKADYIACIIEINSARCIGRREVTSNVRGHYSCRSGRTRSAARARANVNASVGKCAYGTHRVATIGPRMGGIAAGGRGRHGGGEPLCCLRATKTMRRHQAARDAPRRLCRSSYTQAPRCTHVYAPSSGDGGLKQTRRKEKQTWGRTGRHSERTLVAGYPSRNSGKRTRKRIPAAAD